MHSTPPAVDDLAAAREAALVVLREPSAFYCMRMWDRALQRAADVARQAGVPDEQVRRLCGELQDTAAREGRGPDWVVREARRCLYRLVADGVAA